MRKLVTIIAILLVAMQIASAQSETNTNKLSPEDGQLFYNYNHDMLKIVSWTTQTLPNFTMEDTSIALLCWILFFNFNFFFWIGLSCFCMC